MTKPASIGITGGGGVLGSRLVKKLLETNSGRITIFSRHPPAMPSQGIRHVAGDVRDLDGLERGLAGCDTIFHLAALNNAGDSFAEPAVYFDVNTQGTARVMEACRKLRAERVVFASSGHVYGAPARLPLDEDSPTAPRSIYAASKLAAEAVVRGYSASFGIACITARLANLYGAGVGSQTILGRAIEQVRNGRPIQLRSVEEIRDFLYLDDAAEALIRLATVAPAAECHIVNVSTAKGVRIGDAMLELAAAARDVGLPPAQILPPTGEPDREVPTLVFDNRRLRNLTGWAPGTPMREGLAQALRDPAAPP